MKVSLISAVPAAVKTLLVYTGYQRQLARGASVDHDRELRATGRMQLLSAPLALQTPAVTLSTCARQTPVRERPTPRRVALYRVALCRDRGRTALLAQ